MVLLDLFKIGTGIASSQAAAREARKAERLENERLDKDIKYRKEVHKYEHKRTRKQFKYAQKEAQTARINQDNLARYQDQTARNQYRDVLAIRNFEYAKDVRAYNESERIYGRQRVLNRAASTLALQDESRRYNELIKGMSFEHQDMLTKMLKEQGAVEARGGQGVSARRLSGDVLAQYGRNQAIQLQNLLSAERESLRNEKQVQFDQYQADVAADARRMLQPLMAPAPTAPLAVPRATILDPLDPDPAPEPVRGVNTVQTHSGLTIASNFLQGGGAQGIAGVGTALIDYFKNR